MSDFLKIFFVLCGLVAAFLWGRNYGEKTITESKDFAATQKSSASSEQCSSDLQEFKKKFQDALDSTDLKKSDEILSKIMTIFLADLSLHLSEQQQSDYDQGKTTCSGNLNQASKTEELKTQTQQAIEKIQNEEKLLDEKQGQRINFLREKEKKLIETTTEAETQEQLKNIDAKDLNGFLKGTPQTSAEKAEIFLGNYRGPIIDLNKKIFGEMLIHTEQIEDENKVKTIKTDIKVFRKSELEYSWEIMQRFFGYSPENTTGTAIDLNTKALLLFPIQKHAGGLHKIAGYFYERLPNGTTKTIGSFILDQE